MVPSDLKRGDVVFYVPFEGCDPSQWERGIVKRMCDDGDHAFVLYDTRSRIYYESDLDNYTTARTQLASLQRTRD